MPTVLGAQANPDTKDLVHQNQQVHLRVCCGRKNYRLQSIQLSKISRGYAPNPTPPLRGDPDAPRRGREARMCAPELMANSPR